MTRPLGTLLLLSAMAFGCGDDDGGCVYDSECAIEEMCVDKACVPREGSGGSGGSGPADGAAAAGGTGGTGGPNCGNGTCDLNEGCAYCPQDCGNCPSEGCGDGACSESDCEHCANCPDDCGPCQPGMFDCGNGVCEPGEDSECEDCSSVQQTCNQNCASNCDCAQPWTACGVSAEAVCLPTDCKSCFSQNLRCCWCPQPLCGAVTCKNPGEACPGC